MSFILEALRKSESQRRLEAVPDMMRVPVAVSRDRLPPWAIAVIVALGCAVVALAFVSMRDRPFTRATTQILATEPETSAAARQPTPPPTPLREAPSPASTAAAPTPTSPAPLQPAAETTRPAAQLADSARSTLPPVAFRAGPRPQSAPASVTPSVGGVPTPVARPPVDSTPLPSAAALRAAGVAIPELDLQLLVTSPTPASRLVVINGRRYREGDRLAEGAEVVEIVAEGVVLRHAGSTFLVVTD